MIADRMPRSLLPLALLLPACFTEPTYPGDEVMGTFAFEATPKLIDCLIEEVPRDAGFSFQGTFSRRKGQSEAWLTLGGVSREATFDGQLVTSERSAPRLFPECNCGENTSLQETLHAALLSTSQDRELSNACPADPLDGGLPTPDGGVLLPDSTPSGFDAVRACGELVDVVVVEPGAGCDPKCVGCRMVFSVEGVRR